MYLKNEFISFWSILSIGPLLFSELDSWELALVMYVPFIVIYYHYLNF